MAKVLIVYATRTGETQQIAELIAEGIRFAGHQAEVVDAKKIKSESDLENYDAYAFGSSTYHGEMLQAMKTFLFIAEKANLADKPGGAFRLLRLERRSQRSYFRYHEAYFKNGFGGRYPAPKIKLS